MIFSLSLSPLVYYYSFFFIIIIRAIIEAFIKSITFKIPTPRPKLVFIIVVIPIVSPRIPLVKILMITNQGY